MQAILKQQYKDLNSLTWQEITIISLFIILITLWIIRDFSTDHLLIIFRKESVKNSTKSDTKFFPLDLQLMEQLPCSLVHYHLFYQIKILFKV